jgi:hypothetical protein
VNHKEWALADIVPQINHPGMMGDLSLWFFWKLGLIDPNRIR